MRGGSFTASSPRSSNHHQAARNPNRTRKHSSNYFRQPTDRTPSFEHLLNSTDLSSPRTATPMDSSLHEVWQGAAGSPFLPAIGKNSQFFVGFTLFVIGLLLTGVFALNRSLVNVGVLGVPASVAVAFGTVYMFCAVGVYV